MGTNIGGSGVVVVVVVILGGLGVVVGLGGLGLWVVILWVGGGLCSGCSQFGGCWGFWGIWGRGVGFLWPLLMFMTFWLTWRIKTSTLRSIKMEDGFWYEANLRLSLIPDLVCWTKRAMKKSVKMSCELIHFGWSLLTRLMDNPF